MLHNEIIVRIWLKIQYKVADSITFEKIENNRPSGTVTIFIFVRCCHIKAACIENVASTGRPAVGRSIDAVWCELRCERNSGEAKHRIAGCFDVLLSAPKCLF